MCVVAALLALVVRRGSPEAALLLTLGAAVVVLLSLAESLELLMDFLGELVESALASVVETAGAICALIAALPLLRAVLALLLELMR